MASFLLPFTLLTSKPNQWTFDRLKRIFKLEGLLANTKFPVEVEFCICLFTCLRIHNSTLIGNYSLTTFMFTMFTITDQTTFTLVDSVN